MNIPRALAFLAAFAVGVLVVAYRHHGATIDAHLHTSHLHVMDWVLLTFGSACAGGIAYSLFKQPDTFDWRGGFWLVVGGVMIYAVLGGSPELKEATCQILSSRHHVWTSPCYY